VAVAAALAGGVIDVRGVLALFAFAVACRAANRAAGVRLRLLSHLLMLLLAGGLMLHVLPGFDNPRLLTAVVISPDAQPYTKYLNFDKAVAGLFLLGIYAPVVVERDAGLRRMGVFATRFVLVAVAVVAASLALGYVRWDAKLPDWFAVWAVSILFLTALPEEALFRGVVQTTVQTRLGQVGAIALAALLFGLAHAAGGVGYVLLATLAGAGYGWIYAETRSIALAIVAHTAIDALHLLFFTYPALAVRGV
jgi:membrane protease YdiL (CAAX protease family)